MIKRLHRSFLILPVNVTKFVEKAYLRGADAVVLDLEDAIPPGEKDNARGMVKKGIESASRGGSDVFVRVNNDAGMLGPDIEASICPGLHGLFLPKIESGREIIALEETISSLERSERLQEGQIKLSVHIESPKGILALQEIVGASPRIESISMGTDDYCLQMGVDPSTEGTELFTAFSLLCIAAKAAGVSPLGILGSVADYKDMAAFRNAAERGRRLGADGAYCIHPDQVKILNEVFSPSSSDVEHARRVIEVFENTVAQGRAAGSLDGKMVDTPIYKQAKSLLQKWEMLTATEVRKAAAIELIKGGKE